MPVVFGRAQDEVTEQRVVIADEYVGAPACASKCVYVFVLMCVCMCMSVYMSECACV